MDKNFLSSSKTLTHNLEMVDLKGKGGKRREGKCYRPSEGLVEELTMASVVRSVKRVERSAGRWRPGGGEAVGLPVAGSASLDRLGL